MAPRIPCLPPWSSGKTTPDDRLGQRKWADGVARAVHLGRRDQPGRGLSDHRQPPAIWPSPIPNYFLDLANSLNGTLTITPATLVITANTASRAYGAADPTFTYTISGFIIGGTPDVTGQPSFKTTSVSSSHVGSYTVVPGTGLAVVSAVFFVFVPAEFDITRAPLSSPPTTQARRWR